MKTTTRLFRFLRKKDVVLVLLTALACTVPAQAEVTAFPLFLEPAVFPQDAVFCGHAVSWMDFDQVLNQQDSPFFAHNFNVGTDFQFFATAQWSLSMLGNEVFEFKAYPGNPFLFDPRALLTNIVLMSDFSLGDSVLEFWLQHDCNHSVDQAGVRDAVHTDLVVGLSWPTKERVVFGQPFTFGWRAQESVTLPLYYQDVSPEPNGEQTSLEIHTVPFTLGKKTEVFVDVKGTLIVRQTGTPVAVPSPVSLDGRCVLGVDFGGERGKLRLFYRLDRTTDPEVDDNPVPSVTSTLGVEAIFQ